MANVKKAEDRKWSFTMYLGRDHRKLIKKEATRLGVPQSEMMRIMINKYFGVDIK